MNGPLIRHILVCFGSFHVEMIRNTNHFVEIRHVICYCFRYTYLYDFAKRNRYGLLFSFCVSDICALICYVFMH